MELIKQTAVHTTNKPILRAPHERRLNEVQTDSKPGVSINCCLLCDLSNYDDSCNQKSKSLTVNIYSPLTSFNSLNEFESGRYVPSQGFNNMYSNK